MADKILVWKDVQSWKDEVLQLLTDSFNDTIKSFNQCSPDTLSLIDKEKMKNLILDNGKNNAEYTSLLIDKLPELIDKLPDHYDGLRAYHACRPIDVESYYSKGLNILNPNIAYDFFLSDKFPELNKKMIDEAINQTHVIKDEYQQRIDLLLDDEWFISNANQYLKYGSEFLQYVAVNLPEMSGRVKNYKEIMKDYGKPTIFICEIPFSIISGEEIQRLGESLIEILSDALKDPSLTMPKERDYAISLFERLPAEYIIDHYHPKGF
jgi:hypothetical protein